MACSQSCFDIVIVGAGPAGLFLGVCLARWGYRIKHIDNRELPTISGRADGLQPRTLHLWRNMGLKRSFMAHEPGRVYEVSFWDPAPAGKGICRSRTSPTCPKYIDARYPFTATLHQGAIERILIEDMAKNGASVQRPWSITDFDHCEEDSEYPLQVSFRHEQNHQTETVRAKYLFSATGSQSLVRDRLGIQLLHRDPVSHVWGVIDGVVQTNFPDIRPQAGQGMNTAMHDSLNLAWKIHQVEAGFANKSILSTYESERKPIAKALLDFDAKYAALFSQSVDSMHQAVEASQAPGKGEGNEFVKTFKEKQEFTSGYGVSYPANELNWSPDHPATSALFLGRCKLRPGYVMPSANVTRVVDGNPVQLEQEVPLNGSFRIFVFASKPGSSRQALSDLAVNLQKPRSFFTAYKRSDEATVSCHERHNPHSLLYTICTIFAASRDDIEISEMVPSIMARYSHHVYADDAWDVRVPDATASAHAKMGLDVGKGGVAVVRPDGHVGCAVQLIEGRGTVRALDQYFSSFTTKVVGQRVATARL
ncbi:MAG: hypothetical protein Q9228_005298 [Teloschistes exilis]